MNLLELPDNEENQRDCAKREAPVSYAREFTGCRNCPPTSTSTADDLSGTKHLEALMQQHRLTCNCCKKTNFLALDNQLEFLSF